jgi:chloramphenicol O-acetyltransferase type A
MKKIDVNNWNRKSTYEFYKDMDLPRYQITIDLDITGFYQYVKVNHFSFYFSFMWLVLKELNQIDNFKYRFVDKEVYLFDVISPSFTDKVDDGDTFKIVNTNFIDDITKFQELAKKKSREQGNKFINLDDEVRQDLVYISTFPWAKVTHASNPTNVYSKDAVPRIGWAKFERQGEKMMMPLIIEVHHAFVDGFHVGKLINALEKRLKEY